MCYGIYGYPFREEINCYEAYHLSMDIASVTGRLATPHPEDMPGCHTRSAAGLPPPKLGGINLFSLLEFICFA